MISSDTPSFGSHASQQPLTPATPSSALSSQSSDTSSFGSLASQQPLFATPEPRQGATTFQTPETVQRPSQPSNNTPPPQPSNSQSPQSSATQIQALTAQCLAILTQQNERQLQQAVSTSNTTKIHRLADSTSAPKFTFTKNEDFRDVFRRFRLFYSNAGINQDTDLLYAFPMHLKSDTAREIYRTCCRQLQATLPNGTPLTF